jgi:hypothetical protein
MAEQFIKPARERLADFLASSGTNFVRWKYESLFEIHGLNLSMPTDGDTFARTPTKLGKIDNETCTSCDIRDLSVRLC